MTDAIRVFVGTSADGSDAESCAVFEHTLRQHASQPVDITWLKAARDPNDPCGGWQTRTWGTPFSGVRWATPSLCDFQGRAIYADGDMIWRADVAELWGQPIPPGAIALVRGYGRKMRTCVMVMDCEAAGRWLPPLAALKAMPDAHATITARLASEPQLTGQIDGLWNCVDLKGSAGVGDPNVKLIHYSHIATQMHLHHAKARLKARGRKHWYDGAVFEHRSPELQALFDRLLAEASAAGLAPETYEPATPYTPTIRSYRGVRVKGFSA